LNDSGCCSSATGSSGCVRRSGSIDGAIGEGSEFHATKGFYAQGVGPGTAVLPDGWLDPRMPLDEPQQQTLVRRIRRWARSAIP